MAVATTFFLLAFLTPIWNRSIPPMNSFGRVMAASLSILTFALPAQALSPDCSICTSRQFLVYGSDLRLRGAVCDLAESLKRDLLQLINQRDTWSAPIVINAHSAEANLPDITRASLTIGQTGFGLRLQLELEMEALSLMDIRRQLLRTILLEMSHRNAPGLPAGKTYSSPPNWLAYAIEARNRDVEWPTAMSLGKAFSLDEFLRTDPDSLDTISRTLYCAYSVALIEQIVRLPDGRERLARFIVDSEKASKNCAEQFRKHFPLVTGVTGVSRQSIASPILSAEETERRLEQILNHTIPDAVSGRKYSLDEFPVFLRDPAAKRVLVHLGRDLRLLEARAQPIYAPLIGEYEKTTALLSRRKTSGITERLFRLRESRKVATLKMRKISDYMNWFEATQSKVPSGLFDDYMRAADAAESAGDRRHDSISVYLDVLETQFQN